MVPSWEEQFQISETSPEADNRQQNPAMYFLLFLNFCLSFYLLKHPILDIKDQVLNSHLLFYHYS